MTRRPPPPPRKRKLTQTRERLAQMARGQWDPERTPREHYARPHHFAVNGSVTEDELANISGERVIFCTPPEPGGYAEYGSWRSDATAKRTGEWFVPERTSGSDYAGGFVALANYEYLVSLASPADFYVMLRGAHGTYGLALDIERTPREVWETLMQLEAYPVVDDELLSQMEERGVEAAWESSYASDWRRLLEERTGYDLDALSNDALREHFEEMREGANLYWEPEGETRNMHIDVDRVWSTVTDEDIDEFLRAHGLGPEVMEPGEALTDAQVADAIARARFPVSEKRVREYLRRGLRPGYDFNPRRPPVDPALSWREWLGLDPYAERKAEGRTRVIHNLLHDAFSPDEKALLLEERDLGRYELLVVFWEREGDQYFYAEVPVGIAPSEVFDTGRWPAELMHGIYTEIGRRHGAVDLGAMDPVLGALGGSSDPVLRAMFYRWTLGIRADLAQFANVYFKGSRLEAALDSCQEDQGGCPPEPDEFQAALMLAAGPSGWSMVRREDLERALPRVFSLGFTSPAPLPPSVAPRPEPEPELEPVGDPVAEAMARMRGHYSRGTVRGFLDRGLRPGYDFNGRYWVFALNKRGTDVLRGEGWGPYDLPTARAFARIGAARGAHDRVVVEGPRADPDRMVRRYEAGTGATLYPNPSEVLDPSCFDPVELAIGTEVEMEHTADPEVSEHIALEHLSEPGHEHYYTRLRAAGLA